MRYACTQQRSPVVQGGGELSPATYCQHNKIYSFYTFLATCEELEDYNWTRSTSPDELAGRVKPEGIMDSCDRISLTMLPCDARLSHHSHISHVIVHFQNLSREPDQGDAMKLNEVQTWTNPSEDKWERPWPFKEGSVGNSIRWRCTGPGRRVRATPHKLANYNAIPSRLILQSVDSPLCTPRGSLQHCNFYSHRWKECGVAGVVLPCVLFISGTWKGFSLSFQVPWGRRYVAHPENISWVVKQKTVNLNIN